VACAQAPNQLNEFLDPARFLEPRNSAGFALCPWDFA
jgi:hypothetical protein